MGEKTLSRLDYRAWRDAVLALAPVLLGIIGSYVLLLWITGTATTNFEEFALGRETQSYFASENGYPIHCSKVTELAGMLDGWRRRGQRPVILWIGNSQIHAINQFSEDQENASPILFRYFDQKGIDFLTFSFPNANFQEMYVMVEHFRRAVPLRALLVCVVFDDLRETGIRDDVATLLSDRCLRGVLNETGAGRQILLQRGTENSEDRGDMAGVRGTFQERSEAFLNNWLSDHSMLWKMRPQARGTLETKAYLLRNSFFGITAQSKRKIIAGRYELNMKALEALTRSMGKDGTEVCLYIAPLRNDVEIPYVASEYSAFKADVDSLARRSGAGLSDLEGLVPGTMWGAKDGTRIGEGAELDFMHFTSAGHTLLARRLEKILEHSVPGASR